MLATPIKPPSTATIRTNKLPKKYYTIHNYPNTVMAIKLKGYEDLKTSVVSFKTIDDAALVGAMIENHRNKTKEWPIFNFEDLQDDNTLRMTNMISQVNIFSGNIYVHEWDELDNLKMYCVSNFLDLINLNTLIRTNDGFSMQGSVYRFHVDNDLYIQRFKQLLELF
jgi:hypothetical protein